MNDRMLGFLAENKWGVLATIKSDGRPQVSNVGYSYDPESQLIRVSVTADRAKTRNLARDPRAVVHVVGDDFWSYASVSCHATLGEVTTTPGDEAGRALLETYEAITGERHADPDEFFAAMVDEHRLVLTLTATGVAGSGW